MTTVPDFQKVTASGGVFIYSNPVLENVPEFASLAKINSGPPETAISINNNDALKEINGFNKVLNFGRYNQIADNDALESISGFASLLRGDEFQISNNPALETISGFGSLDFFTVIVLKDLPNLSSVTNFGNSDTAYTALRIDNTALTSFEGFKADAISGLSITNNRLLEDLDGFNDIAELSLTVTENSALTSISGFESVDNSTSNPNAPSTINISSNSSFDCSAEPQASLPFLPIETSTGNLINCPTAE